MHLAGLRTYTTLGACAAVLVAAGSAWASTTWIPTTAASRLLDQGAGPAAPDVTVHGYNHTGIDLSIDVPGINVEFSTLDKGQFIEVTWPEASFVTEPGMPALPVVRKLFLVPDGAEIQELAGQITATRPLPSLFLILPGDSTGRPGLHKVYW